MLGFIKQTNCKLKSQMYVITFDLRTKFKLLWQKFFNNDSLSSRSNEPDHWAEFRYQGESIFIQMHLLVFLFATEYLLTDTYSF